MVRASRGVGVAANLLHRADADERVDPLINRRETDSREPHAHDCVDIIRRRMMVCRVQAVMYRKPLRRYPKSGTAKLFGLDGPATPDPEPRKYPDPNSHSGVLPTDFAGTWRVRIDGRWEGTWEIDVEDRRIYGRFTSDDTKSVYEIAGKITALPHNAKIKVELAQTDQEFDAYLWTKDKSAMAGTVIMADRKIGFFATREKNAAAPKKSE